MKKNAPQRRHHRSDLLRLAKQAMTDHGLQPEFSASVEEQVAVLHEAARESAPDIRDLRDLLWCSLDNDDSRDLDQLTVCELLPDGTRKMRVAIADVDALVKKGSAIDRHAQFNTTSVYTSAQIFPMLPEQLSTNLTSLNDREDRLALVTEMIFSAEGRLTGSTLYRATVRNQAKLAYDAVSEWIEGRAALPAAATAVTGMDEQLHMQDALAQQLRVLRHTGGSLEFETFQPRAVFAGEQVIDIRQQEQNRARQLIEEVMIATNGCTARFLAAQHGASLRRVVRSPERWLRIVAVAAEYGVALPPTPDSSALEGFLAQRRRLDPLRFPDLSLVIVKLMGRGEYVVEAPGTRPLGHFGLAVRDYTHSTAPNRRFPDLITARMLKAALSGEPPPYSNEELNALAAHCTQQEDAAQKVERQIRKSEAALLLERRIGEHFDAVVTGNTMVGIWVRIFAPPAEGKLVNRNVELAVGERVRVRLVSTDVERGFIDFQYLGL
ncbi:MAG: RNB domain-containing ribonuclease [Betaproteobacteria bacterium]